MSPTSDSLCDDVIASVDCPDVKRPQRDGSVLGLVRLDVAADNGDKTLSGTPVPHSTLIRLLSPRSKEESSVGR